MRKANCLSLILVSMTLLSGIALSRYAVVNAEGTSANASVHVSEACSMSAGTPSNDSISVDNSTFTENVSLTKFTVKCNDASGFAIYAIGYSNDTYGTTDMIGSTSGLTIPTGTDALNGNTTSHWSMLVAKDTSSYLPANLTIENNFNNYHVIPDDFTKIASFSSNTDGVNGAGSSINTSYAVRISATQAADTYVGKVKYVLVHPNKVDNSNKPVAPMASTDCPANSICYAPNASDIEGSMSSLGTITSSPKAGRISVGTSATTIDLIAPNYKRTGFGFAGWSTDFEANNSSTIYGPNETITITAGSLSPNGMILYPVWIASAGNLQGWNGCSSLADIPASGRATLASMTALKDVRDDNVYTVAKLADGKCWMTENLRLDNTVSAATMASGSQGIGGVFTSLPQSADANWSSNTSNNLYTGLTIYTLPQLNTNNTNIGGKNASGADLSISHNANNDHAQWYSYGNYYSWAAAIADTTAHTSNNEHVSNTSICPTNWHLPEGGDKDNKANSEFWALGVSLTGNEPANTSSSTYPYYTGNPEGNNASMAFRAFPNNFIYSGHWEDSSPYIRGNYGFYWSSSAYNSGSAYYLRFYSSFVTPGTYYHNKYYGFAVRCVAGESGS